VNAFLSGDLAAGHAIVELCCGALFGAITVWLEYRIAALFLSRRAALVVALLFAFGTSEWSIASRSLFQHGPTLLLLNLALYVILRARERPHLLPYAALPLAYSFAVRPSNFISVMALTLYVAIHHRQRLVRFLLWSLPVALPFLAYNLAAGHALFPRYYSASAPALQPFFLGFALNLVSPSRGLLVFTPIVLFSIAGMVIAWRRRWLFPLTPYLVAIVAAHTILIAPYWSGHAYGPRYFTDMTHLFAFFLIPVLLYGSAMRGRARQASAGAFAVLAAWGVFVHAHGATSQAANLWNQTPVDIERDRGRAWDWSDPQFLRGLR
jgi:hypothetical protein